eukprot:114750_1
MFGARSRLSDLIEHHRSRGALLAPRLDDHARTSDHLARLALCVDLAQAGPLAELLAVLHFNERNRILRAQCSDQLGVRRLIAAFSQNAQSRLLSVQRLHGLLQATGQAVVVERRLDDLLEGLLEVHWLNLNNLGSHVLDHLVNITGVFHTVRAISKIDEQDVL